MPVYVYRCQNNHESTLIHPIGECNLTHNCVLCNGEMHRVPQLMIHYNNPAQSLLNRLNDAFIDKKARNDKWKRRKQLGKIID
jgi:hypothetical protein